MTRIKRPLSALNYQGLTLVELLVALVVAGIVLAAVATLAFAMGAANDTSGDTSLKQAQVRLATLRISELVRHCKLICAATEDSIVLWKADDNPENGIIDVFEIAYIEKGSDSDSIRILEFTDCPEWFELSFRSIPGQVDAVGQIWLKNMLISQCEERYTPVLPQCSDVRFGFDVLPPYSRFVSISFDLVENDIVHQYQINASMRGWAENLLDGDGVGLIDDDD